MKSYTDLEQSKKLAEFLPLESADCYWEDDISVEFGNVWHPQHILCWSLVALLSVLPFHLIVNNQRYAFNMIKCLGKNGETYAIKYAIFNTTFYLYLTDYYNNPVDAAFEMIVWLKENGKL